MNIVINIEKIEINIAENTGSIEKALPKVESALLGKIIDSLEKLNHGISQASNGKC